MILYEEKGTFAEPLTEVNTIRKPQDLLEMREKKSKHIQDYRHGNFIFGSSPLASDSNAEFQNENFPSQVHNSLNDQILRNYMRESSDQEMRYGNYLQMPNGQQIQQQKLLQQSQTDEIIPSIEDSLLSLDTPSSVSSSISSNQNPKNNINPQNQNTVQNNQTYVDRNFNSGSESWQMSEKSINNPINRNFNQDIFPNKFKNPEQLNNLQEVMISEVSEPPKKKPRGRPPGSKNSVKKSLNSSKSKKVSRNSKQILENIQQSQFFSQQSKYPQLPEYSQQSYSYQPPEYFQKGQNSFFTQQFDYNQQTYSQQPSRYLEQSGNNEQFWYNNISRYNPQLSQQFSRNEYSQHSSGYSQQLSEFTNETQQHSNYSEEINRYHPFIGYIQQDLRQHPQYANQLSNQNQLIPDQYQQYHTQNQSVSTQYQQYDNQTQQFSGDSHSRFSNQVQQHPGHTQQFFGDSQYHFSNRQPQHLSNISQHLSNSSEQHFLPPLNLSNPQNQSDPQINPLNGQSNLETTELFRSWHIPQVLPSVINSEFKKNENNPIINQTEESKNIEDTSVSIQQNSMIDFQSKILKNSNIFDETPTSYLEGRDWLLKSPVPLEIDFPQDTGKRKRMKFRNSYKPHKSIRAAVRRYRARGIATRSPPPEIYRQETARNSLDEINDDGEDSDDEDYQQINENHYLDADNENQSQNFVNEEEMIKDKIIFDDPKILVEETSSSNYCDHFESDHFDLPTVTDIITDGWMRSDCKIHHQGLPNLQGLSLKSGVHKIAQRKQQF